MPPARKPSAGQFEQAAIRVGARLDGTSWPSSSSRVGPITLEGRPAFLKVTDEPEELLGVRALIEWHGDGAVRVIAQDANAIVLERAGATMRSVLADDDAATRAVCRVAARLHAHEVGELSSFPTLADRFRSLFTDSAPRFDRGRVLARELLERSTRAVLLHGDLHSENVLQSPRGWVAIDPKGIVGPRTFEYGPLFTNWTLPQAVDRFDTRLRIVSAEAEIEPTELLRWVAAWSALSAVWSLEDDDEAGAEVPLAVMGRAMRRLGATPTRWWRGACW